MLGQIRPIPLRDHFGRHRHTPRLPYDPARECEESLEFSARMRTIATLVAEKSNAVTFKVLQTNKRVRALVGKSPGDFMLIGRGVSAMNIILSPPQFADIRGACT